MPIIKDKYGAKGDSPRSKFITRDFNKAVVSETIPISDLNTQQKQANITESIRVAAGTSSRPEAVTQAVAGVSLAQDQEKRKIIGGGITIADTVQNIFTLKKGESIKDIIISHYHSSGTATVTGLYWSAKPPGELLFNVSTGVITAIGDNSLERSSGDLTRIFTDTIPSSMTTSLSDAGITSFQNLTIDIYFYMLCSVLGPTYTIIKA